MKGRPIRSIPECEAISTNVHFNMVNEKKFFKLFAALTKNCEENIFMLNKIRDVIEKYLNVHVAGFCERYAYEEDVENIEHYMVVKDFLIGLRKQFEEE